MAKENEEVRIERFGGNHPDDEFVFEEDEEKETE